MDMEECKALAVKMIYNVKTDQLNGVFFKEDALAEVEALDFGPGSEANKKIILETMVATAPTISIPKTQENLIRAVENI